MKLFGYWTILVALVISGVAAYYSIVGLVAIFAAAMLPIIVMGGALEVGKLTTAVWLHTYWDKAEWHIKSYLSVALVLLMFITSMGIFGFLSKAHIEQTAAATEGVAQLERIEAEIARYEEVIARSESKIQKLDNTNTDQDAGIQEKIDSEQQRIDTAYDRIQPAIDEQKQLLEANLGPYQTQLDTATEQLALLQQYSDANDVMALQRLVGAKPDGRYGPGTAGKVEAFRVKVEGDRDTALAKMQELRDTSSAEILRIRGIAEKEIADSNKLISRLRDQLGRNDNADQIALDIQAERAKIKESNTEIDALFERKYAIEGENRKLEAEVGPVKYIADMVYGEQAGTETLEQAVRWVIIILVIVFDPLAVVLIIAGITLVEDARSRRKKLEPRIEELEEEAHTLQDEIVELQEEIEEAKHELDEAVKEEQEQEQEDWIEKLEEETLREIQHEEEQRQSEQDSEIESQDVKSMGEEEEQESSETSPEDNHEDATSEEEVVYEDLQGEYTVDEFGNKKYVYNSEQLRLNKISKNKKFAHEAIERMKSEGFWPATQSEAEIEELLANADPDTLEEVYNEITKDLNQKKEI